MSYDVRLVIDTGGRQPAAVTETHSPTYNLGAMFAEALGRPLRSLTDKTAEECTPLLRKAIAAMEDEPARFKTLNPANGWGSYEGALQFLRSFQQDCANHPKARVEI